VNKWIEVAPGRAVKREPTSPAQQPVSLRDVQAARERIRPFVKETPVWSKKTGVQKVSLKLENKQVTGSFKARGASNKMLLLQEQQRQAGVVACSSGNHGLAVAAMAQRLGVSATICVPRDVDPVKLSGIKESGASVSMTSKTYDEAALEADRLVRDEGLTLIHPFDDPDVIAGQGTIGVEILEQEPDVTSVLIPLAGGGLAAGIALAIKSQSPRVQIIGVVAENSAVLYQCLLAGRLIDVQENPTIAGALSGGIGSKNHYTLQMVSHLLDLMVVVSEEMIRATTARLFLDFDLLAEGGGAVAPSGLIAPGVLSRDETGSNPVAILSGGNIDPALHSSIVDEEKKSESR
jgi:threonine dehydratase